MINIYNKNSNSYFFPTNNPETIEAYIPLGADIDTPNTHGSPPLHQAVQLATRTNSSKNLELVYTLIKLGANINAQDNNGKTPLHIAARDWAYLGHPSAIKIVNTLLNYEASTQIPDNNQRFPLDVPGGRDLDIARFISNQDSLA